MGLFTKKGRTHFERDEKGNVVRIEYEGDQPKPKSVYKQLEQKYYEEHPKESPRYKRQQQIKKAGAWLDRNIQPVGGYPSQRRKKTSSGSRLTSMSDYGFGRPSQKQKKPKTKYVIRSGKAYPIAKQKQKKSTKKPYDPFAKYRW